jgi:hypothetical protein
MLLAACVLLAVGIGPNITGAVDVPVKEQISESSQDVLESFGPGDDGQVCETLMPRNAKKALSKAVAKRGGGGAGAR